MKSQKYIGLSGIVLSLILFALEISYQHLVTNRSLILLFVLTLYIGLLSWQYAFYGSWKKSVLPALKITLMVTAIAVVIGLLKRIK